MNKVAKAILAALAVVVALGAVGLLLLNIYIQTAGVQRRLEAQFSEALDVPVRIRGISYFPIRGLVMSGVTIPDTMRGADHDFLESNNLKIRFRLFALFSRRFVVDEITFNDPEVTWAQTPDGKWLLPEIAPPPEPPVLETAAATKSPEEPIPGPSATPAATAAPAPTATPTPAPTATLAPPPAVAQTAVSPQPTVAQTAVPPAPKKVEERPRFIVQMDRFRLKRGVIDFLDRNNSGSVAHLTGIDVRAKVDKGGRIAGTAEIARSTLYKGFVFRNARAPFTYAADTLTINRASAEIGGGTAHASVELARSEPGTPFEMKFDFDEVDLRQALAEVTKGLVQADGKLRGFLELKGRINRREDLHGRGKLVVRDGQMEQYALLQELGSALHIDELENLKLSQAETEFTIRKGEVHVDKLSLQSQNLHLEANGRIRRDGRLDLDARLVLSEALSRRLPGLIKDDFRKMDDTDQRYVDFDIKGTLNKPETNLIELVVGKSLKREIEGFWRMLRGKD